MSAIRIQRKLDSDTLPELRPMIGKTVEIIVRETNLPAVTPGTGDWAAWPAAAATRTTSPISSTASAPTAVPTRT